MQAIPVSRLRPFQPRPEWFRLEPGGVHGLAHEARVLVWTQVLAARVAAEGLGVDADVLGWAAALHDTQREDDGRDPEHGRRAAEWLEAHPDVLPTGVPLAQVAYICRWHVPLDRFAPQLTNELRVFKDSDGLDRWRIYDLDPSRLRSRAAHGLLEASRELWRLTEVEFDAERAFDRVLEAAVQVGVLRAD